MRNLLEYPTTTEERLALLTSLREEFQAQGGIGDMRPLLLSEIAAIVAGASPSPPSSEGERSRDAIPSATTPDTEPSAAGGDPCSSRSQPCADACGTGPDAEPSAS